MDRGDAIDFVNVPTRHLTFLMNHFRKLNSPADFQRFGAYMREKAAEFAAALAEFPAGPARAMAARRLVDAELAKAKSIAAACAKGCAHCCKVEVEVTNDEAELLAQLVGAGHPIDRERLARQAAREPKSPAWSAPNADNRCVFLKADETCGIYAQRPNVCRKVLVVTPPEECALPDGKPHPITIPLAELVISVALSLPGNGPATMAKGLASGLARLEGAPLSRSPRRHPERTVVASDARDRRRAADARAMKR